MILQRKAKFCARIIDFTTEIVYNFNMKLIISPAKQMKYTENYYFKISQPLFRTKTLQLIHELQKLSYPELKEILNCSDALAKKAYEQYQHFDPNLNCVPALFAYKGIQYQYLASEVLDDDSLAWLQEHLNIVSALYGLLRCSDGIVPYRLEMQAKFKDGLYSFWNDDIAKAIKDDVIVNLASEEYAKVIRPYKKIIDVRFFEESNGKFKEKGVYVKMARGNMVRYLALNKAKTREDIYSFDIDGYSYKESLSNENTIVFARKG